MKTDEDLRPIPVKDQIAKINQINAFLKHHAPAGQLTDFEFLPTDDFDSEPDPSSLEDEAADGDTPSPDEGTAVK